MASKNLHILDISKAHLRPLLVLFRLKGNQMIRIYVKMELLYKVQGGREEICRKE